MECEATGWRCSANPLRHLPTTRGPQAVSSLAAQVDHACRETGFLYVSGHALSQADIDRQLALVQRLFALPQGSKEVLDAAASPLARGYNSLAHGRHNCTPEDGLQDVKVGRRERGKGQGRKGLAPSLQRSTQLISGRRCS